MQKDSLEPSKSRRTVLKAFGAASALIFLPGRASAEGGLSFDGAAATVAGPFKKLGEAIAREARGKLGPGGEAQLLLTEYLERGNTKAPVEIHRLAKDGDNKARTVMGYMFDNGIGARIDYPRAVQNFALASYKDDLAQYNLGVMTLYGRGVAANEEKAMEHFMKVKKVPYAFVQMAKHALTLGQGAVALKFAESAARLKEPYGTYLYARLLIEKGEAAKGAKTMDKAAAYNVPEAIESMVYLNEHGIGMPVNAGMAVGWWIVAEVLVRGVPLDQAMESANRYALSPSDYGTARRFAAKWLLKRKAREAFDYSKTLTYSDLGRIS